MYCLCVIFAVALSTPSNTFLLTLISVPFSTFCVLANLFCMLVLLSFTPFSYIFKHISSSDLPYKQACLCLFPASSYVTMVIHTKGLQRFFSLLPFASQTLRISYLILTYISILLHYLSIVCRIQRAFYCFDDVNFQHMSTHCDIRAAIIFFLIWEYVKCVWIVSFKLICPYMNSKLDNECVLDEYLYRMTDFI